MGCFHCDGRHSTRYRAGRNGYVNHTQHMVGYRGAQSEKVKVVQGMLGIIQVLRHQVYFVFFFTILIINSGPNVR